MYEFFFLSVFAVLFLSIYYLLGDQVTQLPRPYLSTPGSLYVVIWTLLWGFKTIFRKPHPKVDLTYVMVLIIILTAHLADWGLGWYLIAMMMFLGVLVYTGKGYYDSVASGDVFHQVFALLLCFWTTYSTLILIGSYNLDSLTSADNTDYFDSEILTRV